MDSLQLIRDQISTVIEFDSLLKLNSIDRTFTREEVASLINGTNYTKAKNKIDAFKERCQQTLNSLKMNLSLAEREYNELVALANAAAPGYPPSKLFVNRTDKDVVRLHNKKVSEFNRRLNAHRAALKKAETSRGRYNNAVSRYNEKLSDLNAQIQEKQKELAPALDKDIISFFKNFHRMVNSFISEKRNFEAFVAILILDETSSFFQDLFYDTLARVTANEIIIGLDEKIDKIIDHDIDLLKEQFTSISAFVKSKFSFNNSILNEIIEILRNLKYDSVTEHEISLKRILDYQIDKKFDFSTIIDPEKLFAIEGEMNVRRDEFISISEEIKTILNDSEIQYESLVETNLLCLEKIRLMNENKNNSLQYLSDSISILSMLLEPERFTCLRGKSVPVNYIMAYINENLKIKIDDLLEEVITTDLCILTATEILSEDETLKLLPTRDLLITKQIEFANGIHMLEGDLQKISEVPREKSNDLRKEMSISLPASVIPFVGLIAMLFVIGKLHEFTPAFGSKNTFYCSLREDLTKKLNILIFAHLFLAITAVSAPLALSGRNKPLLYSLSSTYLLSAFGTLTQEQKLRNLSNV